MAVSQDAITGTQQTRDSYWSRIYKDFLERTMYPPLNASLIRKANAIEKRWGSHETPSRSSMDIGIKCTIETIVARTREP